MIPATLIFSLAVVCAIFSQSQALLEQGVEMEINNSNRANERWTRSLPVSQNSGASLIKKNTRIAEKIRDLRGTSDIKSKSGMMKKKKEKSDKSMAKSIKKKSGKGSGGYDSKHYDDTDSPGGGDGKDSDDSDDDDSPDDSDDSPDRHDFDISDCDSYSNEWLAELASYCGDDLEDLSACKCPSAQELLADGTLVCASKSELGMSPPACPEGCAVCEFCMVVEGCKDIYGP